MYAERVVLETDRNGKLKQTPKLPANKKFEAIFLFIEESNTIIPKKRTPHPNILGKVVIRGDIFSSVSDDQWDL